MTLPDDLSIADETAWLQQLPPQELARFMALLSQNMTAAMRALLSGPDDLVLALAGARQLNDRHHAIANLLIDIFHSRTQSQRVSTLVPYLFGTEDKLAYAHVSMAWKFSRERSKSEPKPTRRSKFGPRSGTASFLFLCG